MIQHCQNFSLDTGSYVCGIVAKSSDVPLPGTPRDMGDFSRIAAVNSDIESGSGLTFTHNLLHNHELHVKPTDNALPVYEVSVRTDNGNHILTYTLLQRGSNAYRNRMQDTSFVFIPNYPPFSKVLEQQ